MSAAIKELALLATTKLTLKEESNNTCLMKNSPMKWQCIFLFLTAILVCTAGLPAPEASENNIESVDMPELYDEQPHDVERRAVSTRACIRTLYVMAFTSSVQNAGTNAGHGIQLQVNGQVRNLRLYDRPGDDALENKGDLWRFEISNFRFADSCIRIGEIQSVTITERSNDGWNIESIVTLVRDSRGGVGLLTQDFHVNRWVDGNAHHSHRQFTLTRA